MPRGNFVSNVVYTMLYEVCMSNKDSDFQMVYVSVEDSEHLSSEENEVITRLFNLCVSVAYDEQDSPRKKHIKEMVDRISHKLLNKKPHFQK